MSGLFGSVCDLIINDVANIMHNIILEKRDLVISSIRDVDKMISSNKEMLPPTSPVLPP